MKYKCTPKGFGFSFDHWR